MIDFVSMYTGSIFNLSDSFSYDNYRNPSVLLIRQLAIMGQP